MRNYLLITKAQLKMMFRKEASGRNRFATTLVGFMICGGLLSVGLAVLCGVLGKQFGELGFVTEMTALLLALDFILTFVFGTIAIMSYLYFSRDNEFLLNLPVGINTIFFSKLTVVYIEEAILGTLLSLPALIVLGITSAQLPVFYLMIVLSVLFLPVLALLVGSVISLPINLIVSFFKNKGTVASFLLLAIFAVIMVVYVLVVNLAPASDAALSVPEDTVEAIKDALSAPFYIIYPIFCLARFGTAGIGLSSSPALSMTADLLIFLGTVAIAAVAATLISSVAYRRAILRQSENGSAATALKKEYTSSGALKALISKDRKELMRNPAFAFQCLAGIVLSPLLVIAIAFIFGIRIGEEADELMADDMLVNLFSCLIFCTVTLMTQMMSVTTNICAMTAFTREGKTFVYDKTIPVPYSVQIKAKRILSLVPAAVSCALSFIASIVVTVIVAGKTDVLTVIASAVMLIACALFTVDYSIGRDLKNPRLDWVTPKEAVKNFATTGVPTLFGMLLSFVVTAAAIGIGVAFIMNNLGGSGAAIGYVAGALLYVLLWLAARRNLSKNASAFFDRASI